MQAATNEFLAQFQNLCERRKLEIKNTKEEQKSVACNNLYNAYSCWNLNWL